MVKKVWERDASREEAPPSTVNQAGSGMPGRRAAAGFLRSGQDASLVTEFKAGGRYFPAFQAFVRSCLK